MFIAALLHINNEPRFLSRHNDLSEGTKLETKRHLHFAPGAKYFRLQTGKGNLSPPEFKFIMLHLFVCLLVYHSRMKDGPCGAENKPVCGLLQLLAERTEKELQRT